MDFLISATTDVGLVKETNQDSLSVKTIHTPRGKMAFAVLCDGMGGLSKGEVASASLVRAFDQWVLSRLPDLSRGPMEDRVVRVQWEEIIEEQNRKIGQYGTDHGVRMGTTAAVLLLTQTRYYILNVGDCRVYEIGSQIRQLTHDQTLVAQEVAKGILTEEEARTDSRQNVLIQCVGASPRVSPEMLFGDVQRDAVYMLCSDGFRHVLSPQEIFEGFHPSRLLSWEVMDRSGATLVETVKQRQEKDNISVVLIRTF